ncbi:uncharacterized protein LOC122788282 isoform X2 [Protopterus annectens]|uniref:uncharacterized protein LOC122788282 isoform X2 n=1 Tax=Protopterus annectens TaxID=7888 RepID=UPI001CFAA324|nr:uncharacterized protein LOC122788282 isoform X2 [Protopterus annectens]XP_043911284.1 uncharacterized protein LOC122788282 isoform X2 [Protopterus annectens]
MMREQSYQDGGSFSDLSKDESDDQDRESLSEVFEGKEKSYYPNIEPFSDFSESEYEQYTEIIERIKRILDQQLTDVLPLATEQTLDSWIINFNKYFQENCRFEQLHDSCIKLAQYVPLLLKRLEGIRGANDNYNRSEKICWMRFYAKKDPGIISVEPKSIDKTMMLSTQRKEKNCSVANFYFMLCEERFNFFPVSQSSTHLSANCKGQLSELGSAEPVILTDTVSNLEYMYFFSSQYMYVAVAVTDNLKNVCCECPCVMGFKSRDGAVCVCILMCKDHMSCCKTTKLRKHQTCIV